MSREWRLYVSDMEACCERAAEYSAGLSRAQFEAKRMAYDATLRNLELLGEAARHVPDDIRARTPGIPWRRIVAVRNILIHGYLSVDNDIIWDILQNEIGALRKALKKLLTAKS